MLRLDPFDLYSIVTGTFRLDGGAMFGVVPKVLWEKVTEVDAMNRIDLATRALLAVDSSTERVLLVDTGCGTKWSPEQASRYGIQHNPRAIADALAAAGLSTDQVTDVVVTHLHFDHNGGLTEWVDEPDGPTRLCFPGARHWIHRRQWEHAWKPHAKDRASYLKEDFAILEGAGVLRIVEGDHPESPMDGLEWFLSHGHTPYQLLPLVGLGEQRLLFVGDLIPTVAHLRLSWVMAYDLLPMTTMSEKEAVTRRGVEQGLWVAFPHDPLIPGVAINGTVERPIVTQCLPF